MRPVAKGRPGTKVIPNGWSDAHRPVVEKTMTATCAIRHPGGTKGPFNDATGSYEITPYEPYYPAAPDEAGPCRVQVLPALEQTPESAGEQIPSTGYLVTVPWDASDEIAVGDVVAFVDSGPNGDPTLAGVDMKIRSFARGSLTWERDLFVTDQL